MEIFETDNASDEESQDSLKNELRDNATEQGERGGNYGELERGRDIFDEEVSTDKAIKIFMDMELKSDTRAFRPPETEQAQLASTGKKSDEIPSVKIARL